MTEVDDVTNWKLPGGKFNSIDEIPADAAYRELEEELGLSRDSLELEQKGRLINNDGISSRFIFTAIIDPSTIKPSVEIAQTSWVTKAKVPKTPNRSHIVSAIEFTQTSKH